jgi:hypothetical protein
MSVKLSLVEKAQYRQVSCGHVKFLHQLFTHADCAPTICAPTDGQPRFDFLIQRIDTARPIVNAPHDMIVIEF